MRIDKASIELQRSGLAKGVQTTGNEGGKKTAETQTAGVAPRNDRVQISDAGRALAAQETASAKGARTELTPERIGEIRGKILAGAYNSVEVVDEVARRMLERGDV
jgi:negative regulator of flagellin synthesis FlgM